MKETMIIGDEDINNTLISVEFKADTPDKIYELIPKTSPGEYISITNRNNLGEVYIYQRNEIEDDVPKEAVWNGTDSDTWWYDEKKDKFVITTAAELVGFASLVRDGVTFKEKEVQLGNNIDLGGHRWTPIGNSYTVEATQKPGEAHPRYSLVIDKDHVFQGVFNGCGYKIFGLAFFGDYDITGFTGFFAAIDEAEIHNVVFEQVRMISDTDHLNYAGVVGIANNSIFTNVIVSGEITSAKPAGICGIAVDTAFYSCKNTANLHARVFGDSGIIAGGICQQITFTKEMVNHLNGRMPKKFVRCVNEGKIEADGTNAKYLWIGHLFGGTYYDVDADTFSFIIDSCSIGYGTHIRVINSDKIKGDCVYFGYQDSYLDSEFNNVSENSKDDLMSGIIGRVDQNIGVAVIKTTSSTVINNMVIPGTVNTMISAPGKNTFYTKNVNPIEEESPYNLEPFFRFIKVSKK